MEVLSAGENLPGPRWKPVLVYDGDCTFCKIWIEHWRAETGDAIDYAPSQEAAARFPHLPKKSFDDAVQLVLPEGTVISGAHAVFRTLDIGAGKPAGLWCYRHVPLFALLSETTYRWIARRRPFAFKATMTLWGKDIDGGGHRLARWAFLSLLAIVYAVAFLSLFTQIAGLTGTNGLLPVGNFLDAVSGRFGLEKFWFFPTLAWFARNDIALQSMALVGVASALLALVGVWQVATFTLCWALYLSLFVAGQAFTGYQWDILLLEAGFLAIWLAPRSRFAHPRKDTPPSLTVLWLYRFLVFRLIFSSGLAKLASGDPTWRDLTALSYHWWTQPLPTPLAWYASQLPLALQKAATVGMFAVELVVPFLVFAPRRPRIVAAWTLITFQVVLALTGNFAFFNLLSAVLCVILLDDAFLSRFAPARFRGKGRELVENDGPVGTAIIAAVLILGLAKLPGLPQAKPNAFNPVSVVAGLIEPFHVVNGYGLFAVMTTSRPEIVIEGSDDGETWKEDGFRHKPGDLRKAPTVVAPHQPRLDWQMWFAALGTWQRNPWLVNLEIRLLQGEPDVLALLETNPFPTRPPKYVRATLYAYRFATAEERRADGLWWTRERKGEYFPKVSLEDFKPREAPAK
jgi:predicted DCC family thiol-disulfide oxidoreductase YuxK